MGNKPWNYFVESAARIRRPCEHTHTHTHVHTNA